MSVFSLHLVPCDCNRKYQHVSISFCCHYWKGHLKYQHFYFRFQTKNNNKQTKNLSFWSLFKVSRIVLSELREGGRGGIVLRQI